MKKIASIALVIAATATAFPAAAQFAKPEDAIKSAVGGAGGACKTCLDAFRKD